MRNLIDGSSDAFETSECRPEVAFTLADERCSRDINEYVINTKMLENARFVVKGSYLFRDCTAGFRIENVFIIYLSEIEFIN